MACDGGGDDDGDERVRPAELLHLLPRSRCAAPHIRAPPGDIPVIIEANMPRSSENGAGKAGIEGREKLVRQHDGDARSY